MINGEISHNDLDGTTTKAAKIYKIDGLNKGYTQKVSTRK